MSGTLQRPYPKEKNPFHEDVTKSKSRIKRTFSNFKDSLRRSFRKNPEQRPIYNNTNNSVRPKPIEPQEEFVIRSRIPDRYAAATEISRHTVAATTSTPVPPPRTSSIRNRNRHNSISSGSNPFNDDVTPLFRDNTAVTHSRHTLNIPQHGHGGMYGSQSTLRTSCESICTMGGTRRKKRTAPQPPTNTSIIVQQDVALQDDSSTLDESLIEEMQRLQISIEQMTEELQNDSSIKQSEIGTSKDDITTANDEVTKANVDIISDDDATITSAQNDKNSMAQTEDFATTDDIINELTDNKIMKQIEEPNNESDIIPSTTNELSTTVSDISDNEATVTVDNETTQKFEHILSSEEMNQRSDYVNDKSEINEEHNQTKYVHSIVDNSSENPTEENNEELSLLNRTPKYILLGSEQSDINDNSDPEEYVTTQTIVLKRNDSQHDSNANEIRTPPIELTTFQPVKREVEYEIKPLSLIERKARFETDITRQELRHINGTNDFQHKAKVDGIDEVDKADTAVDINSNELCSSGVPVVREKLKSEEAHMRYIDDDRDDILEPDVEKLPEQ